VYALANSAQALEFIDLLMTRDQPGSLAIMMEDNGRPGTCVAVDGGGDPDGVFSVSSCITRVCERTPQIAAVILASVRPAYPPDSADIDRWFDLADEFGLIGVELLEWFVVGPDFAIGMREMTGCVPAWPSPSDRRGST
jgi:hypothetical protein